MIDVATAQKIVTDHVRAGAAETVPLDDALGRVLAAGVSADLDYPPFDRAMMDGYAIAFSGDMTGQRYKIMGQIAAGSLHSRSLQQGEAVQINTGAPLPPGADTVVPVEQARISPDGSTVEFEGSTARGQHIARRGSYAKQSECVLNPGLRLSPGELAIAAAVGAAQLNVYHRPEVAILVTGNELVSVKQTPRGAQIRNSNGVLLFHLLTAAGARPKLLGVGRDDPTELETLVRRGLESDLLCLTGGISMGAFDFVPGVLRTCEVDLKFQKVAVKPGKPTLFGVAPTGCLVFGLSGNPLSALVGYMLFVEPALRRRMGQSHSQPWHVQATLNGRVSASGDRQSYHPARVTTDSTLRLVVEPLRWHGSGDPFGVAGANALIVRPPRSPAAVDGQLVETLALSS